MRCWAVLGFLAGCDFSAHGEATGDASPQRMDACVTYSAQLDTCTLQMGGPLELDGVFEFSTLTGELTNKTLGKAVTIKTMALGTLEDPVQAILVDSLRLAPSASLRAIGPRGFAIIATSSITLDANSVIDVSDNGAGARTSLCPNGPAKGENDPGGAAGGGGAGFGGAGGKGGDGNSDNIFSTSAGGKAGVALSAPLGPRGGCPGAPGGDGNENGGAGGRGGGAVWLATGGRIEIAAGAGINAGGIGGGGGIRTGSQGDAGGGGGGSGGVIWLEAPRVHSFGVLAANGGGGGEGSGGDASGALGMPGQLSLARANGGDGASNVGSGGGAGGYKGDGNGLVGKDPEPGGGGGGGGGVGFIKVISPDTALSATSP